LCGYSVHVRPKISLALTAVVTFFAVTVPIFAVLYWYTAASGTWRWVLGAHILIAIVCLLILLRQMRVFVAVSESALLGNGIFSRLVTVDRAKIDRIVLANVYARASPESTVQFVALDERGHCLFRLRGAYWHPGDIESVAAALGVGAPARTAPLAPPEFFRDYPGSRYWFERAN
jgi:hypothetical protein